MTDVAAAVATADRRDLLGLAAALVAVPSVSRAEHALAGAVEARLRTLAPRLEVERVGDNVVARTQLGRERRVVLGGHLDTVPPNGNEVPRVAADVLHGLGSADMKGGLAVLLALAEDLSVRGADARHDVTLVFYVGEEIAEEHNGLRDLFARRSELVAGDFAILLEPTGGWVEAGCQGTLHLRAVFHGARAHSARPWTGVNAIARAAPVLARVAATAPPPLEVDGLEYKQALQLVRVEGGIANNVVPDVCAFVVNRRFAPSLSLDDARAETEALLEGADEIEVVNASVAAPPNLDAPLVAEFVGTLDLAVRPKLGWTDVARFAAAGIPALNFGPGDPAVSHTADEHVERESLDGCHAVLAHFLGIRA
ncbi:MAG TPA: succinyl-diaminopimelate desuccinylase [Acidimicrobiia bacterium]